jgi:septum formation protein
MNKKLILATTSPYRKEAFAMLGIPFESEGSNVDEDFDGRPSDPKGLVLSLAKLKAEAVAESHKENCTVVGFDSIGWFNGLVLEKPQSREEMVERLRLMSGNHYQFYTGIHVINILPGGKRSVSTRAVKTDIEMRNLANSEIEWYLNQDPNYKTYAQGYDPLGTYGSTFIKSVTGSYNNLLRGIPLEVIVEMIKEVGFKI